MTDMQRTMGVLVVLAIAGVLVSIAGFDSALWRPIGGWMALIGLGGLAVLFIRRPRTKAD